MLQNLTWKMLDGKTVIILDDRPLIATSIEQTVGDLRGRVMTFGRGHDVLEMLNNPHAKIDIAVLDERSIGDGHCGILRLMQERGIPLILITSNAAHTETGLAAYASIVLEKPFSEDELTDALRAIG